MPVYIIFRKYKIAADSVTQATKKLIEAIDAKKDEEYHISDSVRESDEDSSNSQVAAWANSARKQLFGK
jgi:hypothetical protein